MGWGWGYSVPLNQLVWGYMRVGGKVLGRAVPFEVDDDSDVLHGFLESVVESPTMKDATRAVLRHNPGAGMVRRSVAGRQVVNGADGSDNRGWNSGVAADPHHFVPQIPREQGPL